jgi:hypothetical protein
MCEDVREDGEEEDAVHEKEDGQEEDEEGDGDGDEDEAPLLQDASCTEVGSAVALDSDLNEHTQSTLARIRELAGEDAAAAN